MGAKVSIPKALIRHQTGLDWKDGIWPQAAILVSPPFEPDRCVFGLTSCWGCSSSFHLLLTAFLIIIEYCFYFCKKKNNSGSDWEVFIVPLSCALFHLRWPIDVQLKRTNSTCVTSIQLISLSCSTFQQQTQHSLIYNSQLGARKG